MLAARRDLLAELAIWVRRGSPTAPSSPRLLMVGGPGPGLPELTIDEVPPLGFEAGCEVVDRAVDEGADLLMLAAPDVGDSVAIAAVAHWIGAEPVRAVGFDHRMADQAWSALVADVRDRLAALPASGSAGELMGDPALATSVGIVVQAVRRRTAVLLDGLGALSAALIAAELEPTTGDWCLLAATPVTTPAELAATALGVSGILQLGLPGGDGIGAAVALQVLRAAVLAHGPDNVS